MEYAAAAGILAATTLLAAFMLDRRELASVAMLYLLAVVVISFRVGLGASLFAAVVSVLLLDFFFVPPVYSFGVSDVRQVGTFAVMLFIALVITGLTDRIRLDATEARERERSTALLYALSRDLGRTRSQDEMVAVAARHIEDVLMARVAMLVPTADEKLEVLYRSQGAAIDGDRVRADARLAWTTGRAVRPGEGVPSDGRTLFVPLLASGKCIGVIGLTPSNPKRFDHPDQQYFVDAFAGLLSMSLERIRLDEERRLADLRAETERLRSTLLSSVSHDLRTPLGVITGVATTLLESEKPIEPEVQQELLRTIDEEARRLNRLISNLLDMTKLESPNVHVKKEWIPIAEVVGAALTRLEDRIAGRTIVTRVPGDLVPIDGILIEQLLFNIVENALKYSPQATPIEITAAAGDGNMSLEIADRGPGIRPGDEQRVFEKFYRGPHTEERDGAGLGLAIAHAIAAVHGGQLSVHNREAGGATFRLDLPIQGSPPMVPPPEPGEPEGPLI